MTDSLELKPSELRCVCDPKVFKFRNTSEIRPLDKVIGQERAVRSIEFGLNMNSPGYNIFVTGMEGTGKSTIVGDIAARQAKKLPAPCDWCLVNNFRDAFRPLALCLPAGKAAAFSRKTARAVEDLKRELPKAFKSEPYHRRSSAVREKYAAQQAELMNRVERFAGDRDLQILSTETESRIVPVRDGRPCELTDLQGLPADQLAQIEENIRATQAEVETVSREIEKLDQALREDMEQLIDETTRGAATKRLEPLRKEYRKNRGIQDFLTDFIADVVENVNLFLPEDDEETRATEVQTPPAFSKLNRYQVNVLVNREKNRGAPVIVEPNPTYHNVFGRIEKRPYMGTVFTDFTMVQAGSLLSADGGFLILDVEALLMNAFVWETLKRTLQSKLLIIEDIAEETGFGTVSLRPEPIPLDVKVILVGPSEPFDLLQEYDTKFNKIFKVRADFDDEVERSDETVQQYARFIARVCREEKLLPFTPKGVAAIVEFGEKTVADKTKLSIRFGPIQALIKEADFWARRNNARYVTDKYVIRAFNEYRFRHNIHEEKIHAQYLDDTIRVDVTGEEIGQVNALAVYQVGEFSFGRPSRITVETFLGKPGLINIEREVKLSGSTHDKGVLILSGYLGRTFAQNHPLSLSISITFEQSYGEIDGDSASATELFAIISSLAAVPIRQGIAVTGSVDQKGRIQAIGGVNQKVEGFFEVCKSKGLDGRQGVIIPRANVKNLMLKKEVVDAVKRGEFHLYAISTVEEGIRILTGTEAGAPDAHGRFPVETVYGAAQRKLKGFLKRAMQLKGKFAPNEENDNP
jgi:lon-related putative ATP-dependent protease